jgi:Na+/proline symporter
MRGWTSTRWIATTAGIVGGFVGTGLRLRKASLIRNHQSPTDFITDRYQSQVLRYTVAIMQAVTSVIYVSAQVVALRTSFNGLFDIDPSNPWAVVIIFAFILLFEWVGGLASVALTDSIQGLIMMVSFVMTAVIVKKNFGGWSDLDPQTYYKPQLYQTPTGETQWGFWQFTLLNFSFFTFPHLIQRIYAAKDLGSLKVAFHVMNVGPWSSQLVSIFLGTVAVQVLKGEGGASPFASIIGAMMNLGGFPEAVGVIAYTASLAAIMSTADSLVIAISQLITVEFIYPFKPNATPKQITWYGRFVSLITVIVALLIGIYWTAGISDLAQLQFPLTFMIIPPFLFGLFASERFDVHPWSMAIGTAVSSIYIFIIYFCYMKTEDALAIDSGITGFLVNMVVLAFVEVFRRYRNWSKKRKGIDKDAEEKVYVEHDGVQIIFADRPTWDYPRLARFGDKPLTPRMLKKAMEGVKEPLTNVWFCAMFFAILTFTTPMVAELLPPLPEDITTYFPGTVNGIPWWAFKILLVSLIAYSMNAIMICQLPDEYPSNDPTKIAKEGIDVSLVELTVPEMGKRTSYDERNEFIAARRSTISRAMVDMGIRVEEEEESTDDDSNEHMKQTIAQRRLSALVLGQDAEIIKESLYVEDGCDAKQDLYPEELHPENQPSNEGERP